MKKVQFQRDELIEFELEDKDAALIEAIQDLTNEIKKSRLSNGR